MIEDQARRKVRVVIVVTFDEMDIACNGAQVVEIVGVAYVTSANDLLDFARDQQLLELGWQVVGAERDVQVAYHQNQHDRNSSLTLAKAAPSIVVTAVRRQKEGCGDVLS